MAHRSWHEADIKAGIREGGSVVGVFIIARTDERGPGYVAYMRAGWARGFKPLRTFRDKSDRVFRSLDKLVDLLRDEFQYRGEISLFVAGDEDLRRFRGLLPADLAALGLETAEKNTSGTEAGERPRSKQT